MKCCLHTDSCSCGDRTLQQSPAEGTAPTLHAASHLALLAMASDAHALHHWNQQEWGQTHTSKTTAASLTSDSCSPALWQVVTNWDDYTQPTNLRFLSFRHCLSLEPLTGSLPVQTMHSMIQTHDMAAAAYMAAGCWIGFKTTTLQGQAQSFEASCCTLASVKRFLFTTAQRRDCFDVASCHLMFGFQQSCS